MKMKTALTIAGSDCSGGAGIQADLKTMTMNGVYAMSAITALTAQNTTGVRAIQESNLAKGFDLAMSVQRAKDYISDALSAQLDLGQGSGPMMHNFDLQGKYAKEAE